MTYNAKLRDPRWQKKRLEILQRDNFTCLACDDSTSELHVHHCYYVSGRQPWEYPNASLLTLCKTCHAKVEDKDSPANWLATGWEISAALENERFLHNMALTGEIEFGSCLAHVMLGAPEGSGFIPIEEILNSIANAADAGVINAEWCLALNRAAEEARKRMVAQRKASA